MTVAAHVVALVLLWAGVAAIVLSSLGILLVRDLYDRLHFLAPAASLGVPLVTIAIAIEMSHPGRPTVKLFFIAAMLMVGSPVLGMATARAAAQREGRVDAESPQ